jgi:hypothetical protein
MDQGKNGVNGASPARDAQRLEQQVEALRGELGDLVGELDRRRHRTGKPLVVVAAASAALAAATGALLFWRRRRQRRDRFREFASAFRRSFAHPERVAPREGQPSIARKVAMSAAAAAASVVARRVAQRLLFPPRSSSRGAEHERHRSR